MIDSTEMVKKVFTQKSGRIETNKGEAFITIYLLNLKKDYQI